MTTLEEEKEEDEEQLQQQQQQQQREMGAQADKDLVDAVPDAEVDMTQRRENSPTTATGGKCPDSIIRFLWMGLRRLLLFCFRANVPLSAGAIGRRESTIS